MLRLSALAISGVFAAGLMVGTAQAGDYGDNHRGDRMEHRDHDRDHGDRHHRRGAKLVIGLGEDGVFIDKRRRHHHHQEHHRRHHDHD